MGLLVILGEYSASMPTNQWPPTLPLAVVQAALLTLLHRPLTAIMDQRWAQAIVFFLGSRLMSVYLWHVPAIVVLTGIQLLWLPMPDPGTGAWWLTRPIFVIAVLLVVWAISTITKRWESPPPAPPRGGPPMPSPSRPSLCSSSNPWQSPATDSACRWPSSASRAQRSRSSSSRGNRPSAHPALTNQR